MIRKLLLVAVVVCGAGAASGDPVEGIWQTEADDGAYAHMVMAACGPNFCGKIVRTFKGGAEYKSENLDKTLVIDMAAQGEGEYVGRVWRPSNTKIYAGTISLNGDALKLAGCVAGGLLCSRQTWMRVK